MEKPIKKANLTKENMWDELQEKYPKGMKALNEWMDLYKEVNHLVDLFREDLLEPIKFHDIPLAMQKGILLEFFDDAYGGFFAPVLEGYNILNDMEFIYMVESSIKLLNEENDNLPF